MVLWPVSVSPVLNRSSDFSLVLRILELSRRSDCREGGRIASHLDVLWCVEPERCSDAENSPPSKKLWFNSLLIQFFLRHLVNNGLK